MIDCVLSPNSPTVEYARSIARSTSRLCLAALVSAVFFYLMQPATAAPKLIGSNPVGNAEQGFSVAVSADGNTAIVGGPFDNSGAGAAWIYTRSGGIWTEQQKLTASDANGAAELGWSVALSANGNTAIVGGPGDNGSIGAAWVFTRNGSTWSQQGAKLAGADTVGNAEQGYSVALSSDGNTAIFGGWADNNSLGAVWVFTRSSSVWSQQGAKLGGNDASGSTDIQQGFSVALSQDGATAIFGGPGDNDGVGAAWVFTLSAGTWTQQGSKLVGANGNTSQQGFSVALGSAGNTALVGGPGEETSGTDTIDGQQVTVAMSKGAVWVFTRSGGTWSQQGDKLIGTSGFKSNPGQGFSVALAGSGNTALLGGPTDNANTGAAWVFARSGGTWNQQGDKLVGPGAVGAASQGTSVAMSGSGSIAIAGATRDQNETGAAWVFTLTASVAHDFNADGRGDILWRNIGGDATIWLIATSGGIQSSVSLGNIPTVWSVVASRDFDGDGTADILWRNTEGDTTMWLMNAGSIAQGTNIGNIPTAWSVVGTGDFNDDGSADILWHDTSGDTTIWFMNGGTITGAAGLGTIPTIWSVAGVGDFNGDGTSDILWHDIYGDTAIWLMSNGSFLSGADLGNMPTTWLVAGTGDFDGDGTSDILWRNTAGDATIWFMKNGSMARSASLGNIPTAWSVAETGDFDGDGNSDILWIDTSGDVAIWFMNGSTIKSAVSLGNVGTAWSVQGANAD